jgi:hypothetical protein
MHRTRLKSVLVMQSPPARTNILVRAGGLHSMSRDFSLWVILNPNSRYLPTLQESPQIKLLREMIEPEN